MVLNKDLLLPGSHGAVAEDDEPEYIPSPELPGDVFFEVLLLVLCTSSVH